MAGDEVVLNWVAKDEQARRAWDELHKRATRAENKLANLNTKQKTLGEVGVTSLLKWAGGFATVTAAVGLIQKGISGVVGEYNAIIEANRRVQKEAGQTSIALDEAFRKQRVQLDLTAIQSEQGKAKTFAAAQRAGVSDVTYAQRVSTQLGSVGFSAEAATGGALEVALQSLAAFAKTGKDVDPELLVSAAASIIKAQQKPLTKENLALAFQQTQRLFKATPIEIGDLAAIAKAAPALASVGVDQRNILASASSLKDIFGGDPGQVGTNLKGFVLSLQAASVQPARKKALESIGLKPEDVDLVGESLSDVTTTLNRQLAKASPEQQTAVLNRLFGREVITAARQILATGPEIQRRVGLTKDVKGFRADIDIVSSGPAAGTRRLAVDKQKRLDQAEEAEAQVFIAALEAVEGPRFTERRREQLLENFEHYRGRGFESEEALKRSFIGGPIAQILGAGGPQQKYGLTDLEAVLQLVRESQQPQISTEMIEILKRIEGNTAKPKRITVEQNGRQAEGTEHPVEGLSR